MQSNTAADINNKFKFQSQLDRTYRLVLFQTGDNDERLSETIKDQLHEAIDQVTVVETISDCENLIKNWVNNIIVLIINLSDEHDTEKIIKRVSHFHHVSTIYVINFEKHHHTATKLPNDSKIVNVYMKDLVSLVADQQYHQRYRLFDVKLQIRSTNFSSEMFGIREFVGSIISQVHCSDSESKTKFVRAWREYCAGNRIMMERVTKFEQQYTANNALYWYTSEPFIYDTLNKALRTLFSPSLQLFEFFIRDIHAQLSLLYESCSESGIIHLYRGQAMNRLELDDLRMRINEIFSMNSFLSTSRDRDIALGFAIASINDPSNNNELQAVLFEIEADFNLAKDKPFADISNYSALSFEKEYLFHLNSLFRLTAIESDQHVEYVGVIRLSLTSLPTDQRGEEVQALNTLVIDNFPDFGQMLVDMMSATSSFMLTNQQIRAKKQLEEIKNSTRVDKYDILLMHGDEAISSFRYSIALEFYLEACQINPLSAHAWTQVAKSYHNLQKHKEAISACRRAIGLYRTTNSVMLAYCHYLLSMSLSEMRKSQEALLEMEETITIVTSIQEFEKQIDFLEDRGSSRLAGLSTSLSKYMTSRENSELLMTVYEQMASAYETLCKPNETMIWLDKALNLGRTLNVDTSKVTRLEDRIQQILHAPQ